MYNWIVSEQDDMPRNVTAALVGTAYPLIEAWRIRECCGEDARWGASWLLPALGMLLGMGLSAAVAGGAAASPMVHIADGLADGSAAILGQQVASGICSNSPVAPPIAAATRPFARDEDALAG